MTMRRVAATGGQSGIIVMYYTPSDMVDGAAGDADCP